VKGYLRGRRRTMDGDGRVRKIDGVREDGGEAAKEV
jgi:hypothetical protein